MENTMCWNAPLAKQGRDHSNSLADHSNLHRVAVQSNPLYFPLSQAPGSGNEITRSHAPCEAMP